MMRYQIDRLAIYSDPDVVEVRWPDGMNGREHNEAVDAAAPMGLAELMAVEVDNPDFAIDDLPRLVRVYEDGGLFDILTAEMYWYDDYTMLALRPVLPGDRVTITNR